jgi:hypothetical protein
MNEYEERQTKRKERLEAKAEEAETESTRQWEHSREITDHIPLGQPILIGHHSEKRHRRDLERSDSAMRRSVEATKKAEYYRNKARSIGHGGISSDDPDATTKLEEKLSRLEENQKEMKRINREFRKSGIDGVTGISEESRERLRASLENRYSWEKLPFARYVLSNNNANIKRIRKRIDSLKAEESKEPAEEIQGDGFTLSESGNRVIFHFDTKPPKETRDILKRNGFRFSPSRNNGWCRMANNAGRYAAEYVMKAIK